jgi:hypothetical protein
LRRRRPDPPDECGQCSASIPRGAWACPACGADEETGWDANPWLPDEGSADIPDPDEEPDYDALGIPGMPRSVRARVIAFVAIVTALSLFIWMATWGAR